jgi:hypothetical protein
LGICIAFMKDDISELSGCIFEFFMYVIEAVDPVYKKIRTDICIQLFRVEAHQNHRFCNPQ